MCYNLKIPLSVIIGIIARSFIIFIALSTRSRLFSLKCGFSAKSSRVLESSDELLNARIICIIDESWSGEIGSDVSTFSSFFCGGGIDDDTSGTMDESSDEMSESPDISDSAKPFTVFIPSSLSINDESWDTISFIFITHQLTHQLLHLRRF